MHSIVAIAEKVLRGEILAAEGKFDESIIQLQEAVAMEDALNFQEPPDWFFSVRHNLGAVQIEAGNYRDAITILEEDLKNYPKNGWAQHGLKLAWQKMGDTAKVRQLENELKKSWATADVKINSSRIIK
jgi:tetratricopeptide (TPR) repeat protein